MLSLFICIFLYFYLLLFSVALIRLLLKYNVYFPLKDIYTSWFLSTVAECGIIIIMQRLMRHVSVIRMTNRYAQKYVADVHNSAKCAFG